MRRVMVRYRVRPEQAAENEALVKAVYEELSTAAPPGFRYTTFKLEDGVSFVHLASNEVDDSRGPLPELASFREFSSTIGERSEEAPVTVGIEVIGSYRFFD
jgi:hypothetical protein